MGRRHNVGRVSFEVLEGQGWCPAVSARRTRSIERRHNVGRVSFQVSKDREWVGVRWSTRFLRSARRTGSIARRHKVGRVSFQVLKGLGVRRSTRFIRSARRTRSMSVDTTLGEFPSKCSKDRVGVRRLVLEAIERRHNVGRVSFEVSKEWVGVRWSTRFLRSARRTGSIERRHNVGRVSFQVLEGLGGCPAVDQFPSKCSKDWVDRTPTQRWASFLPSARRTGWVSGGRPVSFEVLEGTRSIERRHNVGRVSIEVLEGMGGCPAVDQVPSKCSKELGRSNVDTTLGEFPSKCSKEWVGVRPSTRFLRSARRTPSIERRHNVGRVSFEVLVGLGRSGVDTTLGEFPSKCSKDWVGVRRSTRFLRSARRVGWVSGGRPGSFEVLEGLGECPAVDQVPSKCSKDSVHGASTQSWASFLPSAQRTGCPAVDPKCSKD